MDVILNAQLFSFIGPFTRGGFTYIIVFMNTRYYSSEGFVLARRNYSEADRILVVYSERYGKVSLLAKGIRKLSSKKRGSLEVFSRVRFTAVVGKGIDIITDVELVGSFGKIRKDLKKASVAFFLMEVVDKITREGEENKELYRCICNHFYGIENTKSLKELRKSFVSDVLVISGYWPHGKELDRPDELFENITEKKLSSVRIGRKLNG